MLSVTSGGRKENESADRARHRVQKTQPPPTEALKRAPRAPFVCPGHIRLGKGERGSSPLLVGPPRCVSEERA